MVIFQFARPASSSTWTPANSAPPATPKFTRPSHFSVSGKAVFFVQQSVVSLSSQIPVLTIKTFIALWRDCFACSAANAECIYCRADKALQDIVYKVVPGLYRSEMQNRIKFYSGHPEAEPANTEDAGEVTPDSLVFSPEDEISMSIEYFDNFK